MATTATELQPERAATRHSLIELADVEKIYRMGKVDYLALRGVDLAIDAGELIAVVGASGSGKTTVLPAPADAVRARERRPAARLRPAGFEERRSPLRVKEESCPRTHARR